jgi:pilus assembly protein CpaB
MKISSGAKYFVVAGLIAAGATYLIYQFISSKTNVEVRRLGQVVVAELDISAGTPIADRMVKVSQWPEEIIPSSAIRDPKQAIGRVVQVPLTKGEPLLVLKLAPEGTAAGLGGLLDPNKLAVTVRTDDVSGVAGFINPGNRVDILVEMSASGRSGEHFSKIILQNINVLSKGQSMEQSADNKPLVVTTVTLELSPDQAEVLNLASGQGKIRLALRNKLNQGEFFTKGVTTAQLSRMPALIDTSPPKTKEAKEAERKLEVIRGLDRKQENY